MILNHHFTFLTNFLSFCTSKCINFPVKMNTMKSNFFDKIRIILYPYFKFTDFKSIIESKFINKKSFELLYYPIFLINYVCFSLRAFTYLTKHQPLNPIYLAFNPEPNELVVITTYNILHAISEVLVAYVWFFHMKFYKLSDLNSLLKIESQVDTEFRLKVLRFLDNFCPLTFAMDIMALTAYNADYIIEANLVETIICLTWNFLFLTISRQIVTDMIILYVYLYTITATVWNEQQVILKEMDEDDFKCDEEIKFYLMMTKYQTLLKLVKDVRPLWSIIEITAKICMIPLFSCTWMYIIVPIASFEDILFKSIFMTFATIYSIRFYLIEGFLSVTHTSSKKLVSKLHSISVRNNFPVKMKIKLFEIIQDLDSKKNQIAFHDVNDGLATQFDILSSVTATSQIIFLLITLMLR